MKTLLSTLLMIAVSAAKANPDRVISPTDWIRAGTDHVWGVCVTDPETGLQYCSDDQNDGQFKFWSKVAQAQYEQNKHKGRI